MKNTSQLGVQISLLCGFTFEKKRVPKKVKNNLGHSSSGFHA
jgi:hypothetical protein